MKECDPVKKFTAGHRFLQKILKGTLPFLFTLLLFVSAGCASAAPDPEPHGTPWTASELENAIAGEDPIEGFNRSMFACTDFIMDYVADPLGRLYTSILPRPFIDHFDNLCVNLEFPARAFSCLARAEWEGAGDETMRFFINITLGIGGFFDPAGEWFEIYSTDSDFGQTFAAWGIAPGCTLILPLMSSTNVRDAAGSIFDTAFDLKTYIPFAGYATTLNRMVVAHRAYKPVVEGAADPYKAFRELMILRRALLQKQFFYRAKQAAAERRNNPPAEEATPDAPPVPKPEGITANWMAIPGYRSQSPVLDTMRVAMFRAQNNDDPWFFRLSLWNSDFTKKCDDRKIYPFGDEKAFRYGFWKAPEPAEGEAPRPNRLLFILPGIGGHYYSSTPVGLAELAHRSGFAVAVLDSAFTWQFYAVSGKLPGFVPADAELTRRALRLVKADIEEETGVTGWEISLLGYSLGGMHALKIAELEDAENTLDISRFAAVNPPVELANALKTADSLSQASAGWNQEKAVAELVDAAGKQFVSLTVPYPVYDPEAEHQPFDYQVPVSQEQADYFASLYFRMPLRGLLMTAHRDGGVDFLQTPYRWGTRNPLYLEIDRIGFREYAEKILAPETYPDLPVEELYRQSGLRSMEKTLLENRKIRVLHNYDDFLLTPEDRTFLDRTLGERLTWFDHGGHLGNLYVKSVQQAVLDAVTLQQSGN